MIKYFSAGGVVHVAHPHCSTITLCGISKKGGMEVEPQRIWCERCTALIEAVLTIPKKHFRRRKTHERRKTETDR